MIDPLYDGEDEKYGDERHLDERWKKARESRAVVVDPETGLSWAGRSMGEEIRVHLAAARSILWDIRHIGLHHDYDVGIKCSARAERMLEVLGVISLFLNELESQQEVTMQKDNWVHRSAGMKCRTCMFYTAKLTSEPRDQSPEVGRCKRHAPTMSGFPVVYQNDWCGDHKLDEEKI